MDNFAIQHYFQQPRVWCWRHPQITGQSLVIVSMIASNYARHWLLLLWQHTDNQIIRIRRQCSAISHLALQTEEKKQPSNASNSYHNHYVAGKNFAWLVLFVCLDLISWPLPCFIETAIITFTTPVSRCFVNLFSGLLLSRDYKGKFTCALR